MENFDEKIWEEYAKTKSSVLKDKIIEKYVHLIKLVAGRMNIHTNSQIEYEDLLSYGIFGLIDAIDKFDYTKGIKFETYASLRIRGEIIDNIRKIDWIPRTLRQKNKLLENAVSKFEQENGREPTNEELSKILDLPIKDVDTIVKNSHIYNLISLDDYLEQAHEKNNDTLTSTNIKTPEQSLSEKELKVMLANLIDELNENQKKVVALYYYEELTLKEISQIMGISESRVCQIHSKTIKFLRSKIGDNRAEFLY